MYFCDKYGWYDFYLKVFFICFWINEYLFNYVIFMWLVMFKLMVFYVIVVLEGGGLGDVVNVYDLMLCEMINSVMVDFNMFENGR